MSIKESVFVKRADSGLYHTAMSLSLENMQRFVRGYIETVSIGEYNGQNVIMICNEDGKFRDDCPDSFLVFAGSRPVDVIRGDVIFCGCQGEELTGLYGPLKEFRTWLNDQGLKI